jgi:hypothetical protein
VYIPLIFYKPGKEYIFKTFRAGIVVTAYGCTERTGYVATLQHLSLRRKSAVGEAL